MSITVDYFFDYADGLAAIAELMNKSIGCSLSPYQGDTNDMFSRFLGMELTLSKCEFEDDRDLDFENYALHLSLRTPAGLASLREMQLPAMAYIAYLLCFAFKIAGTLVYNGQILLARYEQHSIMELARTCYTIQFLTSS